RSSPNDFAARPFSLSDMSNASHLQGHMVADTADSMRPQGAGDSARTAMPLGGQAVAASRPAVIMQVLPALVTGGVERGTLDVAAAIVQAGGSALVASAGGPMVRELERLGATHVTLPLD